MNKERLSSFFDAVLAIILTILVLELEKPKELNLHGLIDLTPNFFAYTLSFAWLSFMWIGIHNTWQDVKTISNQTVISIMFLLFFSSFIPYTTSIVAIDHYNSFAQMMYGFIAIMVTICVTWNYYTLIQADRTNLLLKKEVLMYIHFLYIDICIKILGMVISALFFPPAVMYSILIAAFALILPSRIYIGYRKKEFD